MESMFDFVMLVCVPVLFTIGLTKFWEKAVSR